MLSNLQVQRNLHFLGFYNGAYNGNLKTFASKKAIKSFQKSFELTRDGIWGINSNTKCIEVIKDIQKKIGCDLIDRNCTEQRQF